jgi:hypothetical protein
MSNTALQIISSPNEDHLDDELFDYEPQLCDMDMDF